MVKKEDISEEKIRELENRNRNSVKLNTEKAPRKN